MKEKPTGHWDLILVLAIFIVFSLPAIGIQWLGFRCFSYQFTATHRTAFAFIFFGLHAVVLLLLFILAYWLTGRNAENRKPALIALSLTLGPVYAVVAVLSWFIAMVGVMSF